MSLSIFLLWLVSIPFAYSGSPPRGFLLNCGSSTAATQGDLIYAPDEGFISVGNSTTLKTPDLVPVLSTLRYFPDKAARKYCYNFPVAKGEKYLIRTTYYYGEFDGGKEPPVFDQIIGGTKWSVVNTTEDYANGLSSNYEIIMAVPGKTLSFCLARNNLTDSSPFISAIEVEYLDDAVYNTTDWKKYALHVVMRTSFGDEQTNVISYPDDQYNRIWQPFSDHTHATIQNHSSIISTDFWNFPPSKAFVSGITASRGKQLEIYWPPLQLPATRYYIAFYFQDNRTPSPNSWRIFNVSVNDMNFFSELNVTSSGVMVYSAGWPLSGLTKIVLTPNSEAPVGPVINAAEVLQILPLGGRTNTRDVIAMEELARTLDNPPADWSGDPCLPLEHAWTGVSCSKGKLVRVISLNLTEHGLSGHLAPDINKLTALQEIWLGGNKISGMIPDISGMRKLRTLHLENNNISGLIPPALGKLQNLREVFLQNNNLEGETPKTLRTRSDVNLQVSPGNPLFVNVSREKKIDKEPIFV